MTSLSADLDDWLDDEQTKFALSKLRARREQMQRQLVACAGTADVDHVRYTAGKLAGLDLALRALQGRREDEGESET